MKTIPLYKSRLLVDEVQYPSTAQLRQLFRASRDMICSISPEGQFIHITAACQQILGYSPEELKGRYYIDFVAHQDRVRTTRAMDEFIRGERISLIENQSCKKDGTLVPLAWSCQWDANEELLSCIVHDLSETKAKSVLHIQDEESAETEKGEWLERIRDGFFAMDNEWRITYINSFVEEMLGIQRTDYLGRNYWECFPQMRGSVYDEQYHLAMNSNVTVRFTEYFLPFDKWFSVEAYPSANGLSVFFRDITEKRKTEQELRNLSLIVKETQNLVLIMNSDHTISWVNEAFSCVTGYSFQDAVGKKPTELLSGPETDAQLIGYIDEQLRQKETFRYVIINYTKGGKKFWIEKTCQPLYDEKGMLQNYFIIGTDITERKKTEEELRNLSLIAKETNNLVIVTDGQGLINWVNDAFFKKTGYTMEEVKGQYPGVLLEGPETNPETALFIQEQVRQGEPFRVDILCYTKARDKFWVEISAQPVYDAQRNVTGYFGIQTDITERKNLQERLDKEKQQRQQLITTATIKAQEQERSLVGRELHDGVNPTLTTIKLYQEVLLSGFGEREELLRKSKDLLQECINDIRNLSKRLSAPTLGNIDLNDTVTELVSKVTATNRFSITLDTKELEELEVSEELHLAVYRILQEHLTNILKYAEARSVQVLFDLVDENFILKVTDDGKGFDTQQKRGGIGISNMISRAECLNGTLTINSAPGLGCVLIASFPLVS